MREKAPTGQQGKKQAANEGRALASQERYKEAIQLLKKASDSGEMMGCTSLGYRYDKGYGVAQNYASARVFFKKAYDAGLKIACVT